MKPSFGKRLTASYLFVVAVTLVFTALFLKPRLREAFLSQLEQSLSSQAALIGQAIEPKLSLATPERNLEDQARRYSGQFGYRVTIIRRDGVVVGDSERTPPELIRMDNHLSRPEVQAALNLGMGESIRHSATLDENMLYVAVPIQQLQGPGSELRVTNTTSSVSKLETRNSELTLGVLRIALPLAVVQRRLTEFQNNLLKAGAAAFLVALIVALFSVHKISHPLRELVSLSNLIGSGQATPLPTLDSRDEFGRLAAAFSAMAARVDEKVGELSRERTQLAAMLSTLIEGIVALDHQGRVLFLNPAAEKFFGVRSEEARDRPFVEVLRQSPLNDVLTETLAKRESVHKEIVTHSPSERVISVNAMTVNYGEGRLGVLAALHDVTELRKLENLRREFVANVSHELKTPLTSIKGYVDTLLDGAIDDPRINREFLGTIQAHTDNLSRLIDDILDLSTIEAQRVTYRFEPVGLKEVLNRIVSALEPMAKSKKVKLAQMLPDDLPAVRADREKLAQILVNLIENAIKFNRPQGEVNIRAQSNGKDLTLTVQDTGCGIIPEDLPRIFERFYRGNKDRSHDIPGTGLGLAIVKHLVEAHHGTISVESVPGQGSSFKFTLALAQTPLP